MRSVIVLAALFALLSVPFAAAGEVNVDAPDVRVWLSGQKVDVDKAPLVQGTPGVDASFETKDVDLMLDGPSCKIRPDVNAPKKLPSSCQAQTVKAQPPAKVDDLVAAHVGLRFGDANALAPEATAAPMSQAAGSPFSASAPQVLLAAAAASASVALLYALTRVLKWTGLAAFLPLYSHLTDAEILDDPNRSGIYRLIQAEPGISTKDIADRLDLAWGTVTHHLGKLEKRRFVVSKKYGKYRRYFANGHGGTDMKDQVAVLRLDRTGDVAALIRQSPGLTQKAVSTALGVSSSTILWHVKRLEGAQLITKVREGKLVRYYPGSGLDQVLVTPAPIAPVTAA